MADVFVAPNFNPTYRFGCRFTVRYDGAAAVRGALLGMGGAAREGCAIAANAAAVRVRKSVGDRLEREMPIDRSSIDEVIEVRDDATAAQPYAVVAIQQRAIPLIRFGAYEVPAGVAAITRRSRGVETRPGAFIARDSSGSDAVFARRTRRRLPIDEQYGPSVRDVAQEQLGSIKTDAQKILFIELMKTRNYIVNDSRFLIGDPGYRTLGMPDDA